MWIRETRTIWDQENRDKFEGLPAGGKLVAEAAIRKGLRVELISGNLFLVEGNGRQEFFESSMSNSIGHIAETITWNKELTKLFFDRSGSRHRKASHSGRAGSGRLLPS